MSEEVEALQFSMGVCWDRQHVSCTNLGTGSCSLVPCGHFEKWGVSIAERAVQQWRGARTTGGKGLPRHLYKVGIIRVVYERELNKYGSVEIWWADEREHFVLWGNFSKYIGDVVVAKGISLNVWRCQISAWKIGRESKLCVQETLPNWIFTLKFHH